MPIEKENLFSLINERLGGEEKKKYAGFQERYFDFGSIFEKKESELIKINEEFAGYFSKALKHDGFRLPGIQSQSNRPGGWMVFATYFSMGKRHDYRESLKRVSAPTLIIRSGKDMQSSEVSKTYSKYISNAVVKTIEDAGHFPFFDKPEAFSKIVGEFLQRASI